MGQLVFLEGEAASEKLFFLDGEAGSGLEAKLRCCWGRTGDGQGIEGDWVLVCLS